MHAALASTYPATDAVNVLVSWGFAIVGALAAAAGLVGFRRAESIARLLRKQNTSVHAPRGLIHAQTLQLMRLVGPGMLVLGLVAAGVGLAR